MIAKDDALTAVVERLNALLGWWGVPIAGGNGTVDGQMTRLQQFASDLLKTCGDAYIGQMNALFNINDRLARSLQDLLHSRRPQEVLAAESEIFAIFLEGASLHAKRWTALTQKLQECSATIARDVAEDPRQQAQETAPARRSGAGQSTAKQTRWHERNLAA